MSQSRVRTELFHENAVGLSVYVRLQWGQDGKLSGSVRINHGSTDLWDFGVALAPDDRPRVGGPEEFPSFEMLSAQVPQIPNDVEPEVKRFGPHDTHSVNLRRTATCIELKVWAGLATVAMFTAHLMPGVNQGDLDKFPVNMLGSWGVIMELDVDELGEE